MNKLYFRDNLKILRAYKKITQRDLSILINPKFIDKKKYGVRKISLWETGVFIPDTNSLVALSNIFKVPMDYLLFVDLHDTALLHSAFTIYKHFTNDATKSSNKTALFE